MKTHVNFEIAKLLKEKGFEGTKSPLWYYKDGTLHKTSTNGYKGLKCWNTWEATQGVRWDAPTVAEVVIWLYQKHGIWVYTKPVLDEDGEWIFKGYVKHLNDFKAKEYQTKLLREPTESYEAAITYVLENLIQGGNNEQ